MSFDFTFRILGTEVFAVTLGKSDGTTEPPRMEGGSGHNFERDQYPPDPTGEVPWQEDRFGFGAQA